MVRWGLAACAAMALAGYLACEPVPYSTACFQINRDARNFCQQQMWVVSVYDSLASLQNADAQYLIDNEDKIIADFRAALMTGMFPDQNLNPVTLRHMIDDLIVAKQGLPI